MKVLSSEIFTPTHDDKYCYHASTFIYYKGVRVSAWFEGSREGMPDCFIKIVFGEKMQSLCMRRLTIGQYMALAFWNPVLFEVGNKLLLFYKAGTFCDRWQTFLLDLTPYFENRELSLEECLTGDFDKDNLNDTIFESIIPAGLNACVKTKPVIIGNEIICGSSVESSLAWTPYLEVFHYDEFGDKNIHFSHRSAPLTNFCAIQPAMVHEPISDRLLTFARTKKLGRVIFGCFPVGDVLHNVYKKYEMNPIQIENPNSSLDVCIVKENLYLICNNSRTERSKLSVINLGLARDVVDGDVNVVDSLEIDNEKSVDANTSFTLENSYPYAQVYDDKIYISYTNGRNSIKTAIVEI